MSQFKKKKDIKTCTTLNQFNVIDIQYSAAENKFFQLHKGVLSTSHILGNNKHQYIERIKIRSMFFDTKIKLEFG